MCTNIVENAVITGWGRGAQGWFEVGQVAVSFDHPFHAPLEHAVSIDFMADGEGINRRVAVELSPDSAQELMGLLQTALARGKAQNVQA